VKSGPRSHCPISLALEAIGDKWSLLILRDLILRGKQRYQELLHSEERISTNILADRLIRLEHDGLISKVADPGDGRQYRYIPTQKALDLLPVIAEMARWTAKYDPTIDKMHPFFQRVKAGNEEFVRETLAQLESRGNHDTLPGTRRTAVRPSTRTRRDRSH